jgi:AcrR family transcriptional regulator
MAENGGVSVERAAAERAKRPYGRSRRDLAEAAIREIERRGFAATTVEDIAAAAGYSPRTFFRQFSSKEDVVFFDLPDILSRLEALLDAPPKNAWRAVSAILIDNCERWESEGQELAQHRTALIHREPALYVRFLEVCQEWEEVIARIFAAERRQDPATDLPSRVLAGSVVAACRVALRIWVAEPTVSLAEHMRAGLDVLQPRRRR